jgi:hypothetical protein
VRDRLPQIARIFALLARRSGLCARLAGQETRLSGLDSAAVAAKSAAPRPFCASAVAKSPDGHCHRVNGGKKSVADSP